VLSSGARLGVSSGTGASTRLRTIAEAAEFLNVPYNWLRVKVTERKVPHARIGKHVRFTEQHLAEIIATGEIAALDHDSRGGRQAPPMRGRRRRRSE
jgi:excisionase family DNA binding protein